MSSQAFTIYPETIGDADAVETLLDEAFGLDRRTKTAYRMREGVEPLHELSLVARCDERIVGTIRFWPASIAGTWDVLLLGPLAVATDFRGHRCGLGLMRAGLDAARGHGYERVILVGDEPYYGKIGFGRVPTGQLIMPGYVDDERLLWLALADGALDGVEGLVLPINRLDGSAALAEPGEAEREQKPRETEKC